MEQRILPKNIFLAHFEIVQNYHHFCKVHGCGFSVKNSIFFTTALKFVDTLLLMSGTKNFAKKYFLSTFWDSTKFSPFLYGPRLWIYCQKFNFPKTALKIVETLLLMSGTNNFAEKYFLSTFKVHFEIVQNFHHFCKVRGCGFSVKTSIFQNQP